MRSLPGEGDGGGAAAEERKRERLGKQSVYSCLFSRARPSWTSGGELCNVTGRAHFPVQSCCCCCCTRIHIHARTNTCTRMLIPTEEQALLWRGRMRQKGCCERIGAQGVITRILVFHQWRTCPQIARSSLGPDRLRMANTDRSGTEGERGARCSHPAHSSFLTTCTPRTISVF